MEFPVFANGLKEFILNNPYDSERDYFIYKIRQNVKYLSAMPEKILREMYHRAFKEQYVIGKKLFDLNQECNDIFLMIHGVVEITLSDGDRDQHLDLLGKGSVIGMNNILYGE